MEAPDTVQLGFYPVYPLSEDVNGMINEQACIHNKYPTNGTHGYGASVENRQDAYTRESQSGFYQECLLEFQMVKKRGK